MAELPESPSTPSAKPPIDHQSLDSVDDQLSVLSLHPENVGEIDTDNNGGDNDGSNLVDRESEGNEEGKIEIEVENVNQKENVDWNFDGKGDKGKGRRSRFPVRLGAENCSFYLRTGLCKFGMNCKFNHPPNRKIQGTKVKGKDESVETDAQNVIEQDESSDREGQNDCKYVDRPGGCKFGKTCKFNHSRKSCPTSELNFMGLPIRLGEKECSYYMRNGSCKYGTSCRYNHPDPTSIGGSGVLPAYSNGGSILSSNASQSTLAPWPSPVTLNGSPPYVPLMLPPTQGIPSRPEWTAYQAPVYPTERNMTVSPAYAMNRQSLGGNVYTHLQEQILVDAFPERPGQPECSYFLKTGNCKYRSACKFHHPKSVSAKSPSCLLSDLGLPIRPGGSICSYYSRYGICKYGPACKYDHPINYTPPGPLPVSAVVDQTPDLDNPVPVLNTAMAAGS